MAPFFLPGSPHKWQQTVPAVASAAYIPATSPHAAPVALHPIALPGLSGRGGTWHTVAEGRFRVGLHLPPRLPLAEGPKAV